MSAILDNFPRHRFTHLPTPLEPFDALSRALDVPDLWIKRDDCTGFALGGNKGRKLEFLMADAEAKNATTILTAGGTQSNHVRQTAAAAARLGFKCSCVLERVRTDNLYETSGNAMLDHLVGARPVFIEHGADVGGALAQTAIQLESAGERVYTVPIGGSNAIGSLGYVECALEMATQFRAHALHPGLIVHASGSAGTQAGLLVGLALAGLEVQVIGMCVGRPGPDQEAKVSALVDDICELINRPDLTEVIEVQCDAAYVGPGYGQMTSEVVDAVSLVARTEGVFLDPVYSGKAMAGLIGYARTGRLTGGGPVVFLHTGGTPALFVYPELTADV